MTSPAGPEPPGGSLRPYLRIAADLRRQIEGGMLPAGSRVPPLGELMERTGHARETCRKALRELERAGLLERSGPRRGYYVTGTGGKPRPEAGAAGSLAGPPGGAGAYSRGAAGGRGRPVPVPLVNMFRQAGGSWPAGTDHLRWLVVPVGEKSEQAAGMLAARHRYLAGYPGLTVVPPRWMHIAVGDAGPAAVGGGLDAGELARLVELVRARCARLPAFSVTFGPPEVTPAGVICPARPAAALLGLEQLTAGALRAAAGRACPAPAAAAGLPHVVVAYATGPGTTAAVEKVLAARASAAPGTRDRAGRQVEVAALHLARVRHDGRRVTWTTAVTVPLLGLATETEDR
jgi:hypothetical protein